MTFTDYLRGNSETEAAPETAKPPCRRHSGYLSLGARRWGVELEWRPWDYAELRFVGQRTRLLTYRAP